RRHLELHHRYAMPVDRIQQSLAYLAKARVDGHTLAQHADPARGGLLAKSLMGEERDHLALSIQTEDPLPSTGDALLDQTGLGREAFIEGKSLELFGRAGIADRWSNPATSTRHHPRSARLDDDRERHPLHDCRELRTGPHKSRVRYRYCQLAGAEVELPLVRHGIERLGRRTRDPDVTKRIAMAEEESGCYIRHRENHIDPPVYDFLPESVDEGRRMLVGRWVHRCLVAIPGRARQRPRHLIRRHHNKTMLAE